MSTRAPLNFSEGCRRANWSRKSLTVPDFVAPNGDAAYSETSRWSAVTLIQIKNCEGSESASSFLSLVCIRSTYIRFALLCFASYVATAICAGEPKVSLIAEVHLTGQLGRLLPLAGQSTRGGLERVDRPAQTRRG